MGTTAQTGQSPDHEYIIIGTGFAGLGMAIQLRKAGEENFVLLERADEVGGTWRENTYPGCACDIPSHLYSFSFDQNPEWSRLYSPWHEIRDYLIHSSEKFDLRSRIRFGCTVTDMHYHEDEALWEVRTASGDTLRCRYLVVGAGPLTDPVIPTIVGIEQFQGPIMHSAQWDHTVELKGKRVVVVGTGASAGQIVPAIAPEVGELHVIQRTPPWVLPRNDKAIPEWLKRIFRFSPFLQRIYRTLIYIKLELRGLGLTRSNWMLRIAEKLSLKLIEEQIADIELREKVTPKYTIGCKRVLMSDDYFPALCRDNVTVHTAGIEGADAEGLVLNDGTRIQADVIIYGTGFHATKPLLGLNIFGLGGRSLKEEWDTERGPEAFYGTCIAGYPNLFVLHGPNVGLGHNSVLIMMEGQLKLIRKVIGFMRKRGARAVDVRPSVQEEHNTELIEKLDRTVWQTGGCQSWYQLENGKNIAIWPALPLEYHLHIRRIDESPFIFMD